MGRRRKKAPRRGSLAYLPRKRAKKPIGKVNHWPETVFDSPKFLGFSGYKVGMNHIYLINEIHGSPNFGQEVIYPITIVETPPIILCAIRAYSKTVEGLKAYGEVWIKKLPKYATRVFSKPKSAPTSIKKIKNILPKISEFRAILFTQPHLTNLPQKKPEIFEVKVSGGTIEQQLTYLIKFMGKEVKIVDVFNEGQFIDVIAITKGKGIQGPVKRWGVKTLPHKSRKTVRGVGTLGPWTPHYVMYTVPRAGQMGFHQRTERNKRILKINLTNESLNPKEGFPHYGIIKNSSILLKGSVPGPTKRLLKFRYAINPPKSASEKTPKITYLGLQIAQTT